MTNHPTKSETLAALERAERVKHRYSSNLSLDLPRILNIDVPALAKAYMDAMEALKGLLYKSKNGDWYVETTEAKIDKAAELLRRYEGEK